MPDEKQIKGDALFQHQQQHIQFNGPHIFCDGLKTPDNLGAILRVADSAGSGSVFVIDNELDLNSKKIGKLARSAQQHVKLQNISLDDFIELAKSYKQISALEITNQSQSLYKTDISSCDAFLVGHENQGIRSQLLNLCDLSIHLPMFGINGSMNISHALAITLFEWRRQCS